MAVEFELYQEINLINQLLLENKYVRYATEKVYSIVTRNTKTIIFLQLQSNQMFVYGDVFDINELNAFTNLQYVLKQNNVSIDNDFTLSDFRVDTVDSFLKSQKKDTNDVDTKKDINIYVETLCEKVKSSVTYLYSTIQNKSLLSRLINITSNYVFEINQKTFKFNTTPTAYPKHIDHWTIDHEVQLTETLNHIENWIKNTQDYKSIDLLVFNLITDYHSVFDTQSYCDLNNRRQFLKYTVEYKIILYSTEESQKLLNNVTKQIII